MEDLKKFENNNNNKKPPQTEEEKKALRERVNARRKKLKEKKKKSNEALKKFNLMKKRAREEKKKEKKEEKNEEENSDNEILEYASNDEEEGSIEQKEAEYPRKPPMYFGTQADFEKELKKKKKNEDKKEYNEAIRSLDEKKLAEFYEKKRDRMIKKKGDGEDEVRIFKYSNKYQKKFNKFINDNHMFLLAKNGRNLKTELSPYKPPSQIKKEKEKNQENYYNNIFSKKKYNNNIELIPFNREVFEEKMERDESSSNSDSSSSSESEFIPMSKEDKMNVIYNMNKMKMQDPTAVEKKLNKFN